MKFNSINAGPLSTHQAPLTGLVSKAVPIAFEDTRDSFELRFASNNTGSRAHYKTVHEALGTLRSLTKDTSRVELPKNLRQELIQFAEPSPAGTAQDLYLKFSKHEACAILGNIAHDSHSLQQTIDVLRRNIETDIANGASPDTEYYFQALGALFSAYPEAASEKIAPLFVKYSDKATSTASYYVRNGIITAAKDPKAWQNLKQPLISSITTRIHQNRLELEKMNDDINVLEKLAEFQHTWPDIVTPLMDCFEAEPLSYGDKSPAEVIGTLCGSDIKIWKQLKNDLLKYLESPSPTARGYAFIALARAAGKNEALWPEVSAALLKQVQNSVTQQKTLTEKLIQAKRLNRDTEQQTQLIKALTDTFQIQHCYVSGLWNISTHSEKLAPATASMMNSLAQAYLDFDQILNAGTLTLDANQQSKINFNRRMLPQNLRGFYTSLAKWEKAWPQGKPLWEKLMGDTTNPRNPHMSSYLLTLFHAVSGPKQGSEYAEQLKNRLTPSGRGAAAMQAYTARSKMIELLDTTYHSDFIHSQPLWNVVQPILLEQLPKTYKDYSTDGEKIIRIITKRLSKAPQEWGQYRNHFLALWKDTLQTKHDRWSSESINTALSVLNGYMNQLVEKQADISRDLQPLLIDTHNYYMNLSPEESVDDSHNSVPERVLENIALSAAYSHAWPKVAEILQEGLKTQPEQSCIIIGNALANAATSKETGPRVRNLIVQLATSQNEKLQRAGFAARMLAKPEKEGDVWPEFARLPVIPTETYLKLLKS